MRISIVGDFVTFTFKLKRSSHVLKSQKKNEEKKKAKPKIAVIWLSGLRMFGILIYARQLQQAPDFGNGKCLRLKCADYWVISQ